jgi:Winged helix DNA-binding domain
VDWEQSRLSHQIARMTKRGLVAREECAEDGRGAFVVLTPAGREVVDAAAPMHVATVRRLAIDASARGTGSALDSDGLQLLETGESPWTILDTNATPFAPSEGQVRPHSPTVDVDRNLTGVDLGRESQCPLLIGGPYRGGQAVGRAPGPGSPLAGHAHYLFPLDETG